ncbi:MAG: N-acetyltransferase [Lachnoclostridium sp.]|nr:N-acetyltransferase [Lachnoclostridium sp.]
MMKAYGENSCKEVLSTFMCPLNLDVEDFIHNKAIPFARQRIAVTFLVFKQAENGSAFVGYYTLANKFVSIAGAHLSKTLQKKIAKFSQYDDSLDRFMVSMPLIAQLGKNFNPNLPFGISGEDLLSMALQRVVDIEYLIGGKTVYIECNNQPKLFDFYATAGFFVFDKRNKQGSTDEKDVLVQMLKYFNH